MAGHKPKKLTVQKAEEMGITIINNLKTILK